MERLGNVWEHNNVRFIPNENGGVDELVPIETPPVAEVTESPLLKVKYKFEVSGMVHPDNLNILPQLAGQAIQNHVQVPAQVNKPAPLAVESTTLPTIPKQTRDIQEWPEDLIPGRLKSEPKPQPEVDTQAQTVETRQPKPTPRQPLVKETGPATYEHKKNMKLIRKRAAVLGIIGVTAALISGPTNAAASGALRDVRVCAHQKIIGIWDNPFCYAGGFGGRFIGVKQENN